MPKKTDSFTDIFLLLRIGIMWSWLFNAAASAGSFATAENCGSALVEVGHGHKALCY